MKCTKCGKQTPSHLPNCVHCGYSFQKNNSSKAPAATRQKKVKNNYAKPASPVNRQGKNPYAKPHRVAVDQPHNESKTAYYDLPVTPQVKQNKTPVIIGICAAALVALIGIGVATYFIFFHDPSSPTTAQIETTQSQTQQSNAHSSSSNGNLTKMDYAPLEKFIVDCTHGFVGGTMELRGQGSQIYFYDDEYAANGIYAFNKFDASCKKIRSFDRPRAGCVNTLRLYNSGFSFSVVNTDNNQAEEYTVYDYANRALTDSEPERVWEYDGSHFYYIADGGQGVTRASANDSHSDWQTVFDLSQTDYAQFYLKDFFVSGSHVFAEIMDDEQYIYLTKINGEYRKFITPQSDSVNYYVADSTVYYLDAGVLYRVDLTDPDFTAVKMCELDADAIYFADGNHVCYLKYQGQAECDIYSLDIGSEPEKIGHTEYLMGGY